MSKTANLYARIEPEIKEQAETILTALGIPASNAINIFYKQIILHGGLPFDVRLPKGLPDISKMTKEEIDIELEKGYRDCIEGKTVSADEAFKYIHDKYMI